MLGQQESRREGVEGFLLAVLVLQVLSFLFFSFETYRTNFNSDAAGLNTYIQQMLLEGAIFPSTHNVTHETPLFGFHLLALPFVGVLGNGYDLHALYSVIVVGLMVWSSIIMLRTMGMPLTGVLLCLVLVMSPSSGAVKDFVFGHASYAAFIIDFNIFTTLLLCYVFQKPIKGAFGLGLSSSASLAALGFCQIFIFGSSLRVALITLIPGLFAMVGLLICGRSSVDPRRNIAIRSGVFFGVLLASSILVFSIFQLFADHADHVTAKAHVWIRVGDIAGVWDGLGRAWPIFLEGLNLHQVTNQDLYYWDVYNKVIFGVLGVAISGLCIVWFLSRPISPIGFFVLFVGIGAIINYLGVVITGMGYNGQSARYFSTHYYGLMVLSVVGISYGISRFRNRCKGIPAGLFVVAFALGGTYGTYNYFLYNDGKFVPVEGRRINPHEHLANILIEHDVTYGYATFWHANVTTVFSEFKTEIFPIHLPPRPSELGPRKAYDEGFRTGRSALIFRSGELKSDVFKSLQERLGQPHQRIDKHGFTVMIYSFNVARYWAAEIRRTKL